MKKYNENDYLYASARIRALEAKAPDRELLRRLCAAKDGEELDRLLEEAGIEADRGAPLSGRYNAALNGLLCRALGVICESVEDGHIYDFLRRPYDCHNVKTAIKCHIRQKDDRDALALMSSLGAADASQLPEAVRSGGYSMLPPAMADAAGRALDEYRRTGDPQGIDFALDAACFADMAREAKETGVAFFEMLTALRADLANLACAVRVRRMNSRAMNRAYLLRALLPGGTIAHDALADAFEAGTLDRLMKDAGFETLAAHLDDGRFAYYSDLCYLKPVIGLKYAVAGAEIPAAYFIDTETTVKNIRMILAAFAGAKAARAGTDAAELEAKLRPAF